MPACALEHPGSSLRLGRRLVQYGLAALSGVLLLIQTFLGGAGYWVV
jgi:hypothetical protein